MNGAVTVASGGTLAPGASGAGILTIAGNTVLNSGGKLAVGAAAVGTNSRVNVLGAATTFNFTSGSILDLTLLGGFGSGGNYTLLTMPAGKGGNVLLGGTATTGGQILGTFVQGTGASGAVVITPSGFSLANGDTFTLSRTGDAAVLSFQPVPEPAAVLGIAAAGLGLWAIMSRRNARRITTTGSKT